MERIVIIGATGTGKTTLALKLGATYDITWPHADTMIWLHYSLPRTMWQLMRRTARRIIDRQSVCNNNRETLGYVLSKDSIFLWLLKSHAKKRHEYGAVFAAPEKLPNIQNWHFLQSPAQTASFLEHRPT